MPPDKPRTYKLNLMGDVMLGRLIDQMFPKHVHEPSEARIAASFRTASNPHLNEYNSLSPWGDTTSLLQSADLNLINLETSATTHPVKWPDKVFNYRMHPVNISALQAVGINYAALANNHTLDFSLPGLIETVKTVKEAVIAFAGAGETREEALRPAVLTINGDLDNQHTIHIWSASDHPSDWGAVPNFHLIDYTPRTRERLKDIIIRQTNPSEASLRMISLHWGPNYAWRPAAEIRALAHFLVDECNIDIIHGHSSHHVQGVEVYKQSLIIYGCGDFVDDYALVESHRNDLSAVWRVTVCESKAGANMAQKRLRPISLDVFPTRIERFQARRLKPDDKDAVWVRQKIKDLSAEMGTKVDDALGDEGQLVVDITKQED